MAAARAVATLALLALATGCGAGTTTAESCGAWSLTRADHSWQAVSAVSPTEAWAVGDDAIVHWDGQGWTEVDHPASDYALTGVAALAPDDVWVVSPAGVLHWDGTEWRGSPSGPSGGPRTTDLAIFGSRPDDVWLVGDPLEHWDGTQWKAFPTPDAFDTDDADNAGDEESWLAASPDGAVWAVGAKSRWVDGEPKPQVGAIQRWSDRGWQSTRVPALRRQFLFNTVTATSRVDAWAAASTPGAPGGEVLTSVIERWDGRRWTVTPANLPASPELIVARVEDVAASSGGSAWAVGKSFVSEYEPLLLRWNGRRWRRVPLPSAGEGTLETVTTLPTGDAWAAGEGLLAHFRPCP